MEKKDEESDKIALRNFKDHIAQFGLSNNSPEEQTVTKSTESIQPQSVSPALKRKRSGVAKVEQPPDQHPPQQASADEAESLTPQRKSTPRSRKASSTSASPSSPSMTIVSKLRDSLRPDLSLVLIGLNPGIMTASLGHPYSHPSNGFWKILYTSGITPVQHRPQDHLLLPDLYGIGNTNVCARPSRRGSELTKAELLEGAKILDDKIALYRPEAACISGKGVWEAVWAFKTGKKTMPKNSEGVFHYGWQDEDLWLGRVVNEVSGEVVWRGAMTFVAPSTSGLNAGMSQAEKEEAWRPIGEWMKKKREEREAKKQTTEAREKKMENRTGI